ncbi:histidine kinase [Citricoccus nitrophenolicus]|uniref:histidine kinase n=1 Tax=Citricoccus nitrophenolicus TaxID=863575 RepID=UPI0031EA1359
MAQLGGSGTSRGKVRRPHRGPSATPPPLRGTLLSRALPSLAGLAIVTVEILLLDGIPDLAELGRILLPVLPLFALSLGVSAAAIVWVTTTLVVLLMGAQGLAVAGMILPTVVVLVACIFLLSRARAVALTVAAGLLLTVLPMVRPQLLELVAFALGPLALTSVIVGFLLSVYRRRSARDADTISTLREEQAKVRQRERTLLAHELHDIVAHDVTVIAMQAQRASFVQDPAKTEEILDGIGGSARQTLQDLRRLVLLLRGAEGEDAGGDASESGEALAGTQFAGATTTAVGLVHDLDRSVRALEESGFTVEMQISGEVARIPASLRQALRRTLREVTTNILKHADQEVAASIDLDVGQDRAVLTSANRLGSRPPVMTSGTGLEATRERAAAFGGTFSVGERPPGHWGLELSIPLDESGGAEPDRGLGALRAGPDARAGQPEANHNIPTEKGLP